MQVIYDVVTRKDNVLLFSFVFYDSNIADKMIKKISKSNKNLNFVLRKS